MKTVIGGSRSITDYNIVKKAIEQIIKENDLEISEVFSGTAGGVDKLGERWAKENNIKIVRYPAPWKDIVKKPKDEIGENKFGKYWKLAGFARNQMMSQDAQIAIVIHNGSSGSKNMIYEMKEQNKPYYEYNIHEKMTDDEIGYTF